LRGDVVAGVTVAAYAIPVSLAYAVLAGLPPQ
jgi:SulP family sulfate permease